MSMKWWSLNSLFIRKGSEILGEPFSKDHCYNLHLCLPGPWASPLFPKSSQLFDSYSDQITTTNKNNTGAGFLLARLYVASH